MNLYVLRHAEAEAKGPKWATHDQDRPLTKEGVQKFEEAVQGLRRLEVKFDLVLSSPFVRARQTAEILVQGYGQQNKLEFSANLSPVGDPRELVTELQMLSKKAPNLVIVGHEPFLSEFVGHLISGRPDCALTLKKGGVCKLEAGQLQYGRCATLKWLLGQRQLRLLSKV